MRNNLSKVRPSCSDLAATCIINSTFQNLHHFFPDLESPQMKNRYYLFVALLAFGTVALTAQTTYIWNSAPNTACDGSTTNQIEGLDWFGAACVDVTLDSTGQTFSVNSTEAGWIMSNGSHSNGANVLPAGTGYLVFRLTGDVSNIDLDGENYVVASTGAGTARQYMRINLYGVGTDCPQLVEGGDDLTIETVSLTFLQAPDEAYGLDYIYTSAIGTVLNEVAVPDSDFNGTTYEHQLPTGVVNLYPSNGQFNIGLENNTPQQQTINIYKSEGWIVAAGDAEVTVQEATATGEPHNLNIFLDSVDLCLGNSEFIIEKGATLNMANVPLRYASGVACLGAHSNGRIHVSEGSTQRFGDAGRGMHLFDEESMMVVEENATAILDCSFYLPFSSGQSYFEVLPGGRLEVTAEAQTFSGTGMPASLLVRVHEGATFDMSRANRQVQELFSIVTVSGAEQVLEPGAFTISPNPTADGVTYIRPGTSERALANVQVIDLTGRVVSSVAPRQIGSQYEVQLPASGMYVVRFTDIDGRVGNVRVVAD